MSPELGTTFTVLYLLGLLAGCCVVDSRGVINIVLLPLLALLAVAMAVMVVVAVAVAVGAVPP